MDTMTRARASELFGALSNPTRLRIVELLCDGERSVNEISEALQIGQSGTSQHLAILARAGVLTVEPVGAVRIYRVRGPRIGRILTLIEEFCAVHHLYGVAGEETDTEAG
jgi:DNA-binding transcriptional ArsR family regulator